MRILWKLRSLNGSPCVLSWWVRGGCGNGRKDRHLHHAMVISLYLAGFSELEHAISNVPLPHEPRSPPVVADPRHLLTSCPVQVPLLISHREGNFHQNLATGCRGLVIWPRPLTSWSDTSRHIRTAQDIWRGGWFQECPRISPSQASLAGVTTSVRALWTDGRSYIPHITFVSKNKSLLEPIYF